MQEAAPIIIKKKKAHGHAHHGGAWKVAYADFVTAMMAFFMVMWIMGMDQPTREVIAGYFRDPIGFDKSAPKNQINLVNNSGTIRSRPGQAGPSNSHSEKMNAVKKLEQRIERAIKADPALQKMAAQKGIELRETKDGLEISLLENETNSELFFKLGSAEVRPQARAALAKLAPVLATLNRRMMVDGHTDARPLGGGGYDNFDLSHDRANAVRRLLVEGGCRSGQFLAVRGFADNQLRYPGDPNHFSNRRVTVLIPYAYAVNSFDGLPAEVSRESIEGVFRLPE